MKYVGWSVIFLGGCVFHTLGLKVLWGWFMVPIFGLPVLNMAQAYSVSLVTTYLTMSSKRSKSEEQGADMKFAILIAYVKPLMAMAIGWVIKIWL